MTPEPASEDELIALLTGVRSSKPSYYRQYRHTAESLDRSIRALESASGALSDVVVGPEQLADHFVLAAVRIFDAPWAVLVVDHPAFEGDRPSVAVATVEGLRPPGERPAVVQRLLEAAGGDPVEKWLSVPLGWPDGHGWLVTGLPLGRLADDTDRALLATLGHQVVVSVRSTQLFGQAERLRAEASDVRRQLAAVQAREMVDREREHLARDLHDTVAQQVLAIGMKLEWCRGVVNDDEVAGALLETRELARETVSRIRTTIAELTSERDSSSTGFADRLEAVVQEFEGRGPSLELRAPAMFPAMPASTERAMAMVIREAIANAVVHGRATHVIIAVTVDGDHLMVGVTDDGQGRARDLKRHLDQSLRLRGGGYGRGLVNMYLRVKEVGGTLEIDHGGGPERSGVALRAVVPLGADLA